MRISVLFLCGMKKISHLCRTDDKLFISCVEIRTAEMRDSSSVVRFYFFDFVTRLLLRLTLICSNRSVND